MTVNMAAAVAPHEDDIRVAQTVLKDLDGYEPAAAASVRQAIQTIGQVSGEPIRIDIPDSPPDRQYFALLPADENAPVVIYRSLRPDEPGWLVTTLLSREAYRQHKQAEQRAEFFKAAVVTGAAVAIGAIIGASGRKTGST